VGEESGVRAGRSPGGLARGLCATAYVRTWVAAHRLRSGASEAGLASQRAPGPVWSDEGRQGLKGRPEASEAKAESVGADLDVEEDGAAGAGGGDGFG
jgi:hypothetical protein